MMNNMMPASFASMSVNPLVSDHASLDLMGQSLTTQYLQSSTGTSTGEFDLYVSAEDPPFHATTHVAVPSV